MEGGRKPWQTSLDRAKENHERKDLDIIGHWEEESGRHGLIAWRKKTMADIGWRKKTMEDLAW